MMKELCYIAALHYMRRLLFRIAGLCVGIALLSQSFFLWSILPSILVEIYLLKFRKLRKSLQLEIISEMSEIEEWTRKDALHLYYASFFTESYLYPKILKKKELRKALKSDTTERTRPKIVTIPPETKEVMNETQRNDV